MPPTALSFMLMIVCEYIYMSVCPLSALLATIYPVNFLLICIALIAQH